MVAAGVPISLDENLIVPSMSAGAIGVVGGEGAGGIDLNRVG